MTPEELELIVQRYWSWRLESSGQQKLSALEVAKLRETILYVDAPKLHSEVRRLHALVEWCKTRLTGGYGAPNADDVRHFTVSLEAQRELKKLLGLALE